jgi:hypothetical protein
MCDQEMAEAPDDVKSYLLQRLEDAQSAQDSLKLNQESLLELQKLEIMRR